MRGQGPGNIMNISGVAALNATYEALAAHQSWEALSTAGGPSGSAQGLLAPGIQTGRVLWPVGDPQSHGINFWRADAVLAKKRGDKLYAMEDVTSEAPTASFKPMQIGGDVAFPRGVTPADETLCIVMRGTRPGDRYNHVAFAVGGPSSEIIADWRGPAAPLLSTIVRDIDSRGIPDDTQYWASLETAFKVALTVPAPFGMGKGTVAALNFSGSPTLFGGGSTGYGAIATNARTITRRREQDRSVSGSTPVFREITTRGPDVAVNALMASEAGGPISPCAPGTKFEIGRSGDGTPMHSAAIFCEAIFSFEDAAYEGPLEFQREEYDDPGARPFKARAHIRFDELKEFKWRGLDVQKRGMWRVISESFFKREETTDITGSSTSKSDIKFIRTPFEIQFPSWPGVPGQPPGAPPGAGPPPGGGDGQRIGDFRRPDSGIEEERIGIPEDERTADESYPQTSHVKVFGQTNPRGTGYEYTVPTITDGEGNITRRGTGPGILGFGAPELWNDSDWRVSGTTPANLSAFQVMLYGDTKLSFGCLNADNSDVVSGTQIAKRSDNGLAFTTVDSDGSAAYATATTFNNAVGSQIRMRKQSIEGAYVPSGYIAEEAYYLNDGVFLNDGIVLATGYPGCC